MFAGLATFLIVAIGEILVSQLMPSIASSSSMVSLTIIFSASILAVLFITTVGFGFVPHSREDIGSFFDDYCQLTVKRLR